MPFVAIADFHFSTDGTHLTLYSPSLCTSCALAELKAYLANFAVLFSGAAPARRLFSRAFALDVSPGRAHNEDIMPNNFDPAIGKATQWRKGQPSPNPGGRPKSRLLSDALRAQLGQIKRDDPSGRTFAEAVAANLIAIACSTDHSAVTAAAEIANRLEGRATQRLEVNDITADLASRSDDELRFHLAHDRWPEDGELDSVAQENTREN